MDVKNSHYLNFQTKIFISIPALSRLGIAVFSCALKIHEQFSNFLYQSVIRLSLQSNLPVTFIVPLTLMSHYLQDKHKILKLEMT